MQSGLGQPFSGCSEVSAVLRKEQSGSGGAGSRRQMQRAICPMLSSHRRDPEAGIVYVSVCGLGEGRGTHRHGILGLNIALFCG